MRLAALVVGLFCVGSTALAEEAAAEGGYLPKEHDIEVLLEAPPVLNTWSPFGGSVGRGFGLLAGNATVVGFGLNGGIGYCLTDLIEIGGSVAIDVYNAGAGGNSATNFTFGLAPMVKLNLGHQLNMGPRFNPFVQTGITFGFLSAPNTSGALFAFEVEPGVEFMVTPRWGFNAYLPLGVLYNGAASQAFFLMGLQYGMIGYF